MRLGRATSSPSCAPKNLRFSWLARKHNAVVPPERVTQQDAEDFVSWLANRPYGLNEEKLRDGDMPPEGTEVRPTTADIETVARWVRQGARTLRIADGPDTAVSARRICGTLDRR